MFVCRNWRARLLDSSLQFAEFPLRMLAGALAASLVQLSAHELAKMIGL